MYPAADAARRNVFTPVGSEMVSGAGTIPPVQPQQPRLHQQIDQLDKVLSGCHQITTDIEGAADRLLGPVPESDAKEQATPSPQSIEAKLSESIRYAERLAGRLHNLANRLGGAV